MIALVSFQKREGQVHSFTDKNPFHFPTLDYQREDLCMYVCVMVKDQILAAPGLLQRPSIRPCTCMCAWPVSRGF